VVAALPTLYLIVSKHIVKTETPLIVFLQPGVKDGQNLGSKPGFHLLSCIIDHKGK